MRWPMRPARSSGPARSARCCWRSARAEARRAGRSSCRTRGRSSLLLLLATAITLNLLRTVRAAGAGGRAQPGGQLRHRRARRLRRDALRRAVPGRGARHGAAAAAGGLGRRCSRRSGWALALPFLAVAFVPALRRRLPQPGPWMARLQRFLAIPMAATAVGCLWLLCRQAGRRRSDRPGVALAVLVAAAGLGRLAAAQGRAGRLCRGAASRSPSPALRSAAHVRRRRRPRRARRRWAPSRGARRGSSRELAAGQAGVRLFHRRLVPDLQGQRGRRDRARGDARRVRARRASRCWSATGPTAIRRSPASSKAGAGPGCRFTSGTSRARPSPRNCRRS